MHEVPEGLRARKKQRTRETIVAVALEQFARRGFDETTVADIAAAADIAPRTFFGYFPAKEDVVFHDFEETLASLAQRLRGRDEGETAFDALRAWVVEHHPEDDEDHRARRLLIRSTPALQARERSNLARLEQLMAEAVARDLGGRADDLQPHLVGAAAVAALEALGRFYDRPGAPSGDPVEEVMDEALVFLRGGLDALRRRGRR